MKNLMFLLVLTGLQFHSSFAQSNLLDNYIHLVSYCPGDDYAVLQAVNDPKPSFKYLWSFNGSTEAQVQLPKSLFGQEICLTRTCPCGKVTKHCISFNPSGKAPEIEGSAKNISCHHMSDGSIAVSGNSSDLTYHWTTPQSGSNAYALSPGSYTVFATNTMGCKSNVLYFNISEPPPMPIVDIEITPTTCPESADGAARILNLSSEATVGWPAGKVDSESFISGLKKGNYQVRLSDQSGRCSFQSFVIKAPEAPQFSSTLVKPVTCFGEADAEVTLHVSDGQAPYSLQWGLDHLPTSPGQPVLRTALAAGNYPVMLTDNKGCTSNHAVTIKQPSPISVKVDLPNHNGYTIPCANQPTAELTVSGDGGNGGFQYTWLDKVEILRFATLSATLEPGSYTVIVTDQKGCSASKTFSVTQPDKIVIKSKTIRKTRLFNKTKIEVKGGTGNIKTSHLRLRLFLNAKKKTKVIARDENGCETTKNVVISLSPRASPKGPGPHPLIPLFVCESPSYLIRGTRQP